MTGPRPGRDQGVAPVGPRARLGRAQRNLVQPTGSGSAPRRSPNGYRTSPIQTTENGRRCRGERGFHDVGGVFHHAGTDAGSAVEIIRKDGFDESWARPDTL